MPNQIIYTTIDCNTIDILTKCDQQKMYVDQLKSWHFNTEYGTNLASIHNRDEMIEEQLLTKGYNN